MRLFGKLEKERAIEIRARLEGLQECQGFQVMKAYFENRINEIRGAATPIVNDDFATINAHNRRLYTADAFEEVLQWVQNAKDECDHVIEGGKK